MKSHWVLLMLGAWLAACGAEPGPSAEYGPAVDPPPGPEIVFSGKPDAWDDTGGVLNGVRLLYTHAFQYCPSCYALQALVEVGDDSADPARNLTLVFSRAEEDHRYWYRTEPATPLGSPDGLRTLYKVSDLDPFGIRFAVHYQADGQSLWDNNAGMQYEADASSQRHSLGRDRELAVTRATLEAGRLTGEVLMRKGTGGQVMVRYSVNGGPARVAPAATWQFDAGPDVELWRLDLDAGANATTVVFSVEVEGTPSGQTVLARDDNYGDGFRCQVPAPGALAWCRGHALTTPVQFSAN